jgi:ribosomal protein S18 acetylase RimI-like enzyme
MTINSDIRCRLIGEADVQSVANLFASAFVSIHTEISRARERVGREYSGVVVATKDGTVVGAIVFDLGEEDDRKTLYIEQLAVQSEHRRQGICSAMMEWLVRFALQFDYEYSFLIVNGTNTAAINCYTRNGFSVRDSRRSIQVDYDPIILRMERDRPNLSL